MSTYSAITIIYNPNSTGSSQKLATDMAQALRSAMPKKNIKLLATKRAGHAEAIAYKHAKASPRPLIVSSSGDGGYHEVVNGILRAQLEGAKPTAGLLPAGNANDHFHSLSEPSKDFVQAITSGAERQIDVLKLTSTIESKNFERYAHSYIGLGLSPAVGEELNKTDLNRLKEMLIVGHTLMRLRHVRLMVNGKPKAFDSLVFTNVGRMAKFLNLAVESKADDGVFEVCPITHRSSLRLLLSLLRASTVGSQSIQQTTEFNFRTITQTALQLDGEIFTLDENSEAKVNIMSKALSCIV